jgi:hypothetical protein
LVRLVQWRTVTIVLMGGGPVKVVLVPLAESFWHGCPELRHQKIGRWFHKQGLAPWPQGEPPRFATIAAGKGKFHVSKHAR